MAVFADYTYVLGWVDDSVNRESSYALLLPPATFVSCEGKYLRKCFLFPTLCYTRDGPHRENDTE